MAIVGCDYTDFGQLSTDCGNSDRDCYAKCEHSKEVFDYVGKPHADDVLHGLAYEHVRLQEEFLEEWCNLSPAICQIGEWLGFPCVQCGQVVQKGFSPCATKTIDCNGAAYKTVSECQELCVDPCQKCIKMEIDFNATPEGQALYTLIIAALQNSLVDMANVTNVDNFIKMIWPDAEVVSYQGMTMYIYLGRAPTPFEESIINIIGRALPMPLGSKIEVVDIDA